MAGIAVIGFIIKYVLPPGVGGGRGHGPADYLLGMNRHDWGDVHFWIALFLLSLLILHLILHWNWIVCRVGDLVRSRKN